MPIKRINEFPEGSGSLSNDDIFLFMDDPSGAGVTKKISLNEISNAIGGGGGGNPFDQNLNTTNSPSFRAINLIDQSVTLYNLTFIGNNAEDGYSGSDLFFTTEDIKGISVWWMVNTINGLQPVNDVYAYVHEGNNGYVIALPGSGSVGYPILESSSATFYNNVSGGINFPNNTSLRIGSYDNGTGGNNGISLNCAVGYELNWQGGHLRSSYNYGNNNANIVFDSPITYSPIVVSQFFSTTLDTDCSLGEIFDITLTDNVTLNNPINPINGKTVRWRILQDGTGGRLITLGDKFVIPSSASNPLPWSIDPNKMDVLAATYHAGRDKWDIVAFVPGY